MPTLQKISYRLAKLAAYLSAIILVYMVVHILIEIVLRVFFAKSTYVLDEFVAYATASITFLCLAYSLHDDALIRVGMLLHRLSGRTRLVLSSSAPAIAPISIARTVRARRLNPLPVPPVNGESAASAVSVPVSTVVVRSATPILLIVALRTPIASASSAISR